MTPTDADRRAAHLVEPAWLREHLHDPTIRVVDIRGVVRTETGPDNTADVHNRS